MKSKLALIFFVLLFAKPAFSFETLNYDCSVWQLPDVKSAINLETNKRILQAIQKQNSCDPQQLIRELKNRLARPWLDNLETWADETPLPRCTVPASQSVYQDFTLLDSPIGITAGLKSVINIGGVYIGTDKLSHFMTEGLQYFLSFKRGANLEDVLAQGMREENGIYGLAMTGIRSYADMSANYLGFKFWSGLLEGVQPMIACENGKWKLERNFKWENYVNDSLDESINCNEFKTERMNEMVDHRTSELRQKARKLPLSCPLKPESCRELTRSLPRGVQEFLLSKRCRESN